MGYVTALEAAAMLKTRSKVKVYELAKRGDIRRVAKNHGKGDLFDEDSILAYLDSSIRDSDDARTAAVLEPDYVSTEDAAEMLGMSVEEADATMSEWRVTHYGGDEYRKWKADEVKQLAELMKEEKTMQRASELITPKPTLVPKPPANAWTVLVEALPLAAFTELHAACVSRAQRDEVPTEAASFKSYAKQKIDQCSTGAMLDSVVRKLKDAAEDYQECRDLMQRLTVLECVEDFSSRRKAMLKVLSQ